MESYDVIIIGSGPSGIITGVTAKKLNPEKSMLMFAQEEKGLVPCGIPYVFYELESVEKNKMGTKPFIDAGGKVIVDTVTKVDIRNKTVYTETTGYKYEKLIFATGSRPVIAKFIKGFDQEGIYYVPKSYSYIEKLREKVMQSKNIVVLGGGFIGVEIAEQIAQHKDKNVYLIEKEKYCLIKAFSEDLCKRAEQVLKQTKIKLMTNTSVTEFIGENGKVKAVKLNNGEIIDTDMVIVSVGYQPNTELAKEAGLPLNDRNAIIVDNYLKTPFPDVFAVGDCAAKIGFVTGRTDNIMLASTATSESRILGYNLFNIKITRTHFGTISVFSTKINGKSFASCGAIERTAEEVNIEFVTGEFEDVDRHPGSIKDATPLKVKLIVLAGDGSIIGGEICGGASVGELINVIALAVQKNVTVYELISFQIGTHPLLTTAPTKYVLIKAAEVAIKKLQR